MKDLIAKLEAAPEGSRELDVEIAVAVGHVDPTCTYDKERDCVEWLEPHEMGLSEPMGALLHDYTFSIDAALTLVPEGWNVWLLGVAQQISNGVFSHEPKPFAEVMNAKEVVLGAHASTPALALCIAALKALDKP